jgi:Arc/MetJ family transcription regulator
MADLVRTNIALDDELIDRAKELTGLTTKRAVVDEALRTLVRLKEQEGIRALRGQLHWEGDLREMRRNRVADPG